MANYLAITLIVTIFTHCSTFTGNINLVLCPTAASTKYSTLRNIPGEATKPQSYISTEHLLASTFQCTNPFENKNTFLGSCASV